MKQAAGVLLYRRVRDKIEILLVINNRRNWSLPKGTVKSAETAVAAARRELLEETTLKAPKSMMKLGSVVNSRKEKKLHCYVAEYMGEVIPQGSGEIFACAFFSISEAKKMIAGYQLPLIESFLALAKSHKVAA
jgi:ADP-ribose pyrophosphatase YjhB (NUDIX family)